MSQNENPQKNSEQFVLVWLKRTELLHEKARHVLLAGHVQTNDTTMQNAPLFAHQIGLSTELNATLPLSKCIPSLKDPSNFPKASRHLDLKYETMVTQPSTKIDEMRG